MDRLMDQENASSPVPSLPQEYLFIELDITFKSNIK